MRLPLRGTNRILCFLGANRQLGEMFGELLIATSIL
jgi:hypothetical protein